MTRDQFWKIIDEARKETDDVFDVAPIVADSLKVLAPDEIISYEQHVSDLLSESYRYDLWGVAYIINGGCSDDNFDRFRGWLLANGRKRWERAMVNPESIGRFAEPEEADYEDMLYCAMDAYEAVTGKQIPEGRIIVRQSENPAGEHFDEDQLRQRYPALCRKFEF